MTSGLPRLRGRLKMGKYLDLANGKDNRKGEPQGLSPKKREDGVAEGSVSAGADRPTLDGVAGPELIARIEAMSLQDFARGEWLVEVWSKRLGEKVFYASNDQIAKAFGPLDGVVYTAEELYRVNEMTGDELLLVHRIKKKFAGTIVHRSGAPQEGV